jgi:hypothetical protein
LGRDHTIVSKHEGGPQQQPWGEDMSLLWAKAGRPLIADAISIGHGGSQHTHQESRSVPTLARSGCTLHSP